jgi:sodium-dependent dicarboxylate transporter 2/3/5
VDHPGLVGIVAGDDSSAYENVGDRLDEGIVAILAASLLFLLPTDWKKREFTLTWGEASRIDWGTIVLFGAGHHLRLGAAGHGAGRDDRHLRVGEPRRDLLRGDHDLRGDPGDHHLRDDEQHGQRVDRRADHHPVAVAAGVNPFVPALAATFAASFGFMLPVSTPQNAIVYGSGVVPITKMLRSGVVFDVIGAILILIGVPLVVELVGIGG